MLNGRSKLRNRAIANVFNQMGLIEAWGTGIRRIREAAAKYGLHFWKWTIHSGLTCIGIPMDLRRKASGKRRENIGKESSGHIRAKYFTKENCSTYFPG
jgi:predicted HTH transcriptional regulator